MTIKRLLGVGVKGTVREILLGRWAQVHDAQYLTFNRCRTDTEDVIKTRFNEVLDEYKPDTLMIYDNRPRPLFNVLMDRKKNERVGYWYGDAQWLKQRYKVLGMSEYYHNNPIDFLFVVTEGQVEAYQKDMGVVACFMPHDFHYIGREPKFDQDLKSDVAFVGQCEEPAPDYYYKERKKFVEYLLSKGCPLRIFPEITKGLTAEQYSAEYYEKAKAHKKYHLDGTYGSGKIFLGIDGQMLHGLHCYQSTRPFITMGYGAFYLTWKFNGMERLFKPDVHVGSFSSFEEGWDKVQFYLKNESEREEIAKKGRELVYKKHLITHRCEDIMQTLETGVPHFSGWLE